MKLLKRQSTIVLRLRQLFAFAALCGVLCACAGAPVQEMSDARQAIAAAEQAKADTAAPGEMTSARHYLEEAQTALDEGEYASARQYALRASQEAVKALRLSQGQPSPQPPT